ncbi:MULTISPECIES: hypothetical protein [unclassified Mycobacterium]|uniref:hypothetical protein n=1 Tax=unclassified Mycobacterium TaxID=2642494 RepID=UPI000FB4F9EA|nr:MULTISPECIES: hypothetical protein [unclassified Mycobacterium]MDP7704107.1 hypothetical protein [Mycobacterium sp. TY815]MDP7722590.1 hypothetical protein [Mycobacterium sp. TY814]RUP02007.1 MAG: hypothetical protein EKK34_26010 [Mycobacterium sp.]
MRFNIFPASIALLFGLGLGAAPQAAAENPTMNGVYHYADEDGDSGTWTITTTCSPACVAHVTTGSGRSFDARLENGRYVSNRIIMDGLECPSYFIGELVLGGRSHPVNVTQWWDPATLTGEVDFAHPSSVAPCTLDDHHDRFTLTPIG